MSLISDIMQKLKPEKQESGAQPKSGPLSGLSDALAAHISGKSPINKRLIIWIPAVIIVLALSYWVMADRPSGKFSLGSIPVSKKIARPPVKPPVRHAPVGHSAETTATPQKATPPVSPQTNIGPGDSKATATSEYTPSVPVVKAPAVKTPPRSVVTRQAEEEKIEQPQEQIKPFILEDPFSQDITSIASLKKQLEIEELRLKIAKARAETEKLQEKDKPSGGIMPPAAEILDISGAAMFEEDIYLRGVARSGYGELFAVLETDSGRWVVREGDVVNNRWVVSAIQDNKVIIKKKGGKEKKELLVGIWKPSGGATPQMGTMPPLPEMERGPTGGPKRNTQR